MNSLELEARVAEARDENPHDQFEATGTWVPPAHGKTSWTASRHADIEKSAPCSRNGGPIETSASGDFVLPPCWCGKPLVFRAQQWMTYAKAS